MRQSRLTIRPLSLAQANVFVAAHHRHHPPIPTHRFSIGVVDEAGNLCGVAICGNPVARLLCDGYTLEVNRVATDGSANACSALYGAARRIAREMGFRRILTYILADEPGTTLRAAGWRCVATHAGGGGWERPNRHRVNKAPVGIKQRWEAICAPGTPTTMEAS